MPKQRAHEKTLPILEGTLTPEAIDYRQTKDREIAASCDGSGKGTGSVIFWHKNTIIAKGIIRIPTIRIDGIEEQVPITSNICEYMAVNYALEILNEYQDYLPQEVWNYKKCIILTDSKLVYHQVSPLIGQEEIQPWKIKNENLKKMAQYFVILWDGVIKQGRELEIKWVSREHAAIWITDAAIRS